MPYPDTTPEQARALFPRGLSQPEKGYRFSLDALLLGCFARPGVEAVLDLGCGCGVAGFAYGLTAENTSLTGLEIDPAMVASAQENAQRLGIAYEAVELDLRCIRDDQLVGPEQYGLALANPPYYSPGTGRPPAPGRQAARQETEAGLEDFIRAASYALANKGFFCLVFPAERLALALSLLIEAKLEPKRLRLVHSRADEPARLALIEGRKNGGPGLRVESPLFLYLGSGKDTRLTDQALAFCPYLACNPGPGAQSDKSREQHLLPENRA